MLDNVALHKKVCSWCKQQSLCFKLEALSSWAPDSPLERIQDKKVASMRSKTVVKKWYQTEIQTDRFHITPYGKNSMYLKKLSVLKGKKTEMKLSNYFYSHKYSWIWWNRMLVWFLRIWIFSLFSLKFVMRRCGHMIASVLDQKNIPTSFVSQ